MMRRSLHRPARSIGGAASCVLERARTDGPQRGRVVGEFGIGHYLRFGDEIVAIGESTLQPGPLHVVFTGPKPDLRNGSPVTFESDAIRFRRVDIDLRQAARWEPVHPTLLEGDLGLKRLASIGYRSEAPPGLAVDWSAVQRAVARDDLRELTALLEGRGEGLTPTGDDVLAGVFLMFAIVRPGKGRLLELAAGASTSDLSRAFLQWAARGHSTAPVHRLVREAAEGQESRAASTAAIIESTGATSGVALLSGIGLASERFSADVRSAQGDRSR